MAKVKVELALEIEVEERVVDLAMGMLGVTIEKGPVQSQMIRVIQNDLTDRGVIDDSNEAFVEAARFVDDLSNALKLPFKCSA